MDYSPRLIGGVVLTHGHFDHMGGLHSLLGFLRMVGRTKPLPILGPPGSPEIWGAVAAFQSYYTDTPFEIRCVEMKDRQTVEVEGVTIQAFHVVHCGSIATGKVLDQIPATGYRISLGGESVAIAAGLSLP